MAHVGKRAYSTHNPSVKRILQEIKELQSDAGNSQMVAMPIEDDIFEWHFTIAGAPDSPFEGGRYHGRIILPPEYPMKPPSIILLTPNGRFEVGKKICLSNTSHHPELWQPSWSVRTIITALISFMPSKPEGAVGSLDYPPSEQMRCAEKSRTWRCDKCGLRNDEHLPLTDDDLKIDFHRSDKPYLSSPVVRPKETNKDTNGAARPGPASESPARASPSASPVVTPGMHGAVPALSPLQGPATPPTTTITAAGVQQHSTTAVHRHQPTNTTSPGQGLSEIPLTAQSPQSHAASPSPLHSTVPGVTTPTTAAPLATSATSATTFSPASSAQRALSFPAAASATSSHPQTPQSPQVPMQPTPQSPHGGSTSASATATRLEQTLQANTRPANAGVGARGDHGDDWLLYIAVVLASILAYLLYNKITAWLSMLPQ
eukprot:Rmarinus@m.15260